MELQGTHGHGTPKSRVCWDTWISSWASGILGDMRDSMGLGGMRGTPWDIWDFLSWAFLGLEGHLSNDVLYMLETSQGHVEHVGVGLKSHLGT